MPSSFACQSQIRSISNNSKVIQFGADDPYCVQATIEWDSVDDFKKAAGSDATSAVMDDVKNFSNTTPKLFTGEVVGSK
jgi:hypothetical protein